METVKLLLDEKGGEVVSVSPDTPVNELARLMDARKIGAVMVLQDGVPVGIVTERDILTKVVAAGEDPATTLARDIMSTHLVVVSPDTALREAMAILTERRHRHLPVLQGGQLCGIISIGDLNRWHSRDQAFTLKYLEQYIRGEYR